MHHGGPIDFLPIWGIFLATVEQLWPKPSGIRRQRPCSIKEMEGAGAPGRLRRSLYATKMPGNALPNGFAAWRASMWRFGSAQIETYNQPRWPAKRCVRTAPISGGIVSIGISLG